MITDYLERKKKDLIREKARSKDAEEEYNRMDKKFKDFLEENDKLKERVKKARAERRADPEKEEKICKKCRRSYLENVNFN